MGHTVIDFIDLKYYQDIYYLLVGMVLMVACAYMFFMADFNFRPNTYIFILVVTLFFVIWVLLGFRPISYAFGDMGNYYKSFLNAKYDRPLPLDSDPIFMGMINFYAVYLNEYLFFFSCLTVYLIPYYVALKKIFNHNWVWGFVVVVALFSFYPFAVNGIRNGMAASLILLALVYSGMFRYIIMLIAVLIHSSVALPAMAIILASRYKNINHYYYSWLFCVVLSLTVPSIGQIIANLGLVDDKLASYANASAEEINSGRVGFRWDFLIYSILPMVTAVYYRYKLNYIDRTFDYLMAIYLTCNGFWVICMQMPYTNRIAYLSWFIYGVVLAYPFIKSNALRFSNRYLSLLVIFQFAFTILMFN